MWTQKDFFLSTIGPLLELSGNKLDEPADVVKFAVSGTPVVSFPIPPLMHGAALWVALMAMFGGNTLVLTSQRKMDPHAIWATVEREKVMAITIVGDAMARPLIEALDDAGASYDLSGLFVIGSGGAMLSPAVKERIAERLPNVIVSDSIGASETGYQGTFAGADDQGRPRFVMGEHTTVLDDDGMPVTPGDGVVGRLARGGYVPIGYYKDPEKTASVFAEAGGKRWVLPGDMAMVEADGTITLLGRGSVSINTGGEKVFPEEVENALKSHPDVFDVVVVGVPDERWGERSSAVVKARPGSTPTVDDLAAHAREHIAGYKVPREVHLVDEVVRSPSGKADYRWAKATATANRGPGGRGGAGEGIRVAAPFSEGWWGVGEGWRVRGSRRTTWTKRMVNGRGSRQGGGATARPDEGHEAVTDPTAETATVEMSSPASSAPRTRRPRAPGPSGCAAARLNGDWRSTTPGCHSNTR